MDFPFRFDRPRQNQDKMMHDIYNTLSGGRSILINAPTGIGKTDAAIAAAVAYAFKNDLDIFFLTPKMSQHSIVVDVLKGINTKFGSGIRYVDLVGKRTLCVNERINSMEGESFYKSCERLVKSGKCVFYSNARKCESMPASLSDASSEGHNRLFDVSFEEGMCAYEIASRIAKSAEFVIADYAHLLNPYTRKAFLKRIAHSLEGAVLIWDESHNILNAASSYLDSGISVQGIGHAAKELLSIGSSIDLGYLEFAIREMEKRLLSVRREAFFSNADVPDALMQNLGTVAEELERAGLEYIEASHASRSSLMHISRFLNSLKEENASVAKIISSHNGNTRLALTCLYPADAVAAFGSAYANVFMSGTLLPLDMYRKLFGMENAEAFNYASPFPRENKISFIDGRVSSRYGSRSQEEYKRIAEGIDGIRKSVVGNIAVFFPAFGVLDSVYRHIGFEVEHIQREHMPSVAVEKLLREFRSGSDATLFGVMGGSLSEGIDYSGNVIKGIIIVGIPLERPSLALSAKVDYLDRRFGGKGAEYAYLIPGVIKAVQAAGRAIRSEEDRAFVVLMDRRYSWGIYRSIIRNFVEIEESADYIEAIRRFMRSREEQPARSKLT